jgi:hypothetical protein
MLSYLTHKNLTESLVALNSNSYFSHLTILGILRIHGKHAKQFLQGQFTNDMEQVNSQKALWGTCCTIQGRMIANFLIWQQEDNYYLVMSCDLIDTLIQALQKYQLRSEVIFENLNDRFTLVGMGFVSASFFLKNITAPKAIYQIHSLDEITYIPLPGKTLIASMPNPIFQQHQIALQEIAPFIDPVYWQLTQIQSGIPWINSYTTEAFLPQMASMDFLGAISLTKGCYKGQEVVARAHYIGQVKRHLYHIKSNAALKEGELLKENANIIGQIIAICPTNSINYEALAVIKDTLWAEQSTLILSNKTLQKMALFS